MPLMSETEHAPVLLRGRVEADMMRLQELLQTMGSTLHVCDTFNNQARDLIKARHPDHVVSADKLEQEISKYLQGQSENRTGTWVHYPWSNRLVHILDEVDFAELRTNRNRYKVEAEEQLELSKKRVGVVGLSVGHSVAVGLALERAFGELRLADFDHLELSNMNRIPVGLHNLGLSKAVIAARAIAEIDPYLVITCYLDGLTESNLDEFLLGPNADRPLDLMVDECDDLAMKVLLRQRARDLRIPVIMHTCERGMLDIERFDAEPQRLLFHGLLGDIAPIGLKDLTVEEKVPIVAKILGGMEHWSPRVIASMLEIGSTLSTWPQLGSEVLMGGGHTAGVIRRVLLNQMTSSGRFFLSPDKMEMDSEHSAHVNRHDHRVAMSAANPVDCSIPELTREIVGAAVLAPSGGNMQPWIWSVDGPEYSIHLRASERPADLTVDFRRLGSYVALGASFENASLRARALGFTCDEWAFRGGAVAGIRLSPAQQDRLSGTLADFIEVRQTGRRSASRPSLSEAFMQELHDNVLHYGRAHLSTVTDSQQLFELGKIVGACDRIRFLNKRLHSELMAELRFDSRDAEATMDGIDVRGLDLSPTERIGLELCRSWPAMEFVRRNRGGRAFEKGARKLLASSALAGVIVANDLSQEEYFWAGRAFQRAWLATTKHGLNLQPIAVLPYLLARIYCGETGGLQREDTEELLMLGRKYQKLFQLRDRDVVAMLFVVNSSPAPTVRALRKPVDHAVMPWRPI